MTTFPRAPTYQREFLDRLRDSVPVSQVLARFIPLKRNGRLWKACCPFHKEKTPSFQVQDDRQSYHCFGCGAHGDHIKFLMEHQRMSFADAVRDIAAMAGIPLPEQPSFSSTGQPQAARPQHERAYAMLEAAAAWFESQLASPAGLQARAYLDKRGLSQTMQARYRIGLAPDHRQALGTHLKTLGFDDRLMIEHGLLIAPEAAGSQPYSRFRSRLMIPIKNRQGKVIAFGGRILGEGQPKYLNSPETPLFQKRLTLFNLDTARKPAHDNNRVLVVEGYMDVIALVQAGMEEAVAPLGTAVTEEHLGTLWQLSDRPILCLDGDTAGQRAMLRVADMALPLMQSGKDLRFAILPAGEDPDSLLKKPDGTAKMEACLAQAVPLSQALWQSRLNAAPHATPEELASLGRNLRELEKKVKDDFYRESLGDFFRAKLYELKQAARQAAFTASKARANPASGRMRYQPAPKNQPARSSLAAPSRDMRAIPIMAWLMRHPDLVERADVEEALAALELQSLEMRHLQTYLLNDRLMGALPPDAPAVAQLIARLQAFTFPDEASLHPPHVHAMQLFGQMAEHEKGLAGLPRPVSPSRNRAGKAV
ncbi:DNA primase [bacterium]|nr:DNA primase [bacterium]